MVKPRYENETRDGKFKRIASARTRKVLDSLRILGNCANQSTYEYTDEDVNAIFHEVQDEMKRIRAKFMKPKHKEFKLK